MKTIEKLLSEIDKITENFIRSFGTLGIEQLNRKPDPQTWSIAQIIDHIIRTNESYYPVIDQIRNGQYKPPFISRMDFLVSFLGKVILKGVQPDRKRKVKTFQVWEPSNSSIPEGIIDRLKKHQAELKTLINNSSDLIRSKTIISSPANKNIVYKLETAFEIIVTHEGRHYNQALEVLAFFNNTSPKNQT